MLTYHRIRCVSVDMFIRNILVFYRRKNNILLTVFTFDFQANKISRTTRSFKRLNGSDRTSLFGGIRFKYRNKRPIPCFAMLTSRNGQERYLIWLIWETTVTTE